MSKRVVNDRLVGKEEKKINWRDVLVRTVKTFIQSFVSYLIMSINGLNFFGDTTMSQRIVKGFILGAVTAGLCAVWNSVLSPLLDIDGTPTVKVVYVDRPVQSDPIVNEEIEVEDDGIDNG